MAVTVQDQEVQCDMEIEMELNHDLLDCAALGDLDRLTQLVAELGADVSTRDSFGQGVLHMAAKNDRVDCLNFILDHMTSIGMLHPDHVENSPIEVTDDYGQTPLVVAAMRGSTSCLDSLLAYGAEVNAPDNMGRTALHLSAMNGHPVCVEILLNSQANLNMVDRWRDNTALHLSASHDHANCLGLLLKTGACIDAQNRSGYTALHLATDNNSETCVALLVSMGANCNVMTDQGLLPKDLVKREACWRLLTEKEGQKPIRPKGEGISLGCMGALVQHGCHTGHTSD
mmetsp:Transcript_3381/g.7027  ORF Transcript_3381/g.7027 Transcript_3381/m.7027 type:complete len:286 (+) Transcript_3381:371-1228(+)|eukprot:CAMPEP_0118922208 /NCGR_PEP_ID=MMETSP1169-20130426/1211_1 /TAXON_ID=36882 /ORGANISM="Pyramimonas obovata, Strain CCMP722" /LENGTH=285 /DNA_ID=CAMNT_0006863039 /DNA_START=349 /DNA_END=1206 /DNA_ORIENTATION=+